LYKLWATRFPVIGKAAIFNLSEGRATGVTDRLRDGSDLVGLLKAEELGVESGE